MKLKWQRGRRIGLGLRPSRAAIVSLLLISSGISASAVGLTLPLELVKSDIPYNLQSTNGMPLSHVEDIPPGSDGRAPHIPSNPPTTNQFSSLLIYGGIVSSAADASIPSATNENEEVVMRLARAAVGAPYLNRPVSFLFGAEIDTPEVDYEGVLLTNAFDIASYWEPEPFTTNSHEGASYYWSPHAEKVFVHQAGPIAITWRKAVPYTVDTVPTNYFNAAGNASFVTNGANVYLLKTVGYTISSTPYKPARKMYWTEKSFRTTGIPVSIPSARVGAVNVVYNQTTFTEYVDEEYQPIGETPVATNGLQELRTLWYEQSQGFMFAYNLEGRVLVELLGDFKEDGINRIPLGYEVVDVTRAPRPVDVMEYLGERLHPPHPGSIDTLIPEPVLQGVGDSFAYRHVREGSQEVELYAAEVTENLNDYLVHWMEEGVESIQWPKYFARYRLVWPTDINRYSHYVRTYAETEEEAEMTAVQLEASNVPFISYQDPLDRPRAKITPESRFYTWLDDDWPVHRTLLRYAAGPEIAFERVYSWLDSALLRTNFSGTVAEELDSFKTHADFQDDYAAYEVDLIDYEAYADIVSRGVNGEWTLYVEDSFPLVEPGEIGSWAIDVVTTNPVSGEVSVSRFSGTEGFDLPDGFSGYRSGIIPISGMDQPVLKIRVILQDVHHSWPKDLEVNLVAPGGSVCALMSDAGGSSPGMSGIALVFDDDAQNYVPLSETPESGEYKPTDYQPGEPLPPGEGNRVATLASLLEALPPVLPQYVAKPEFPPGSTPFPDPLTAPRLVFRSVDVGQRIIPPEGEAGHAAGEPYLAGHINVAGNNTNLNLYHPGAYVDPFVDGFGSAEPSSIIPVNAIPGRNQLEIWWFRNNSNDAGTNAGDHGKGFSSVLWPSILGRYSIGWPESARTIVMAGNEGGEEVTVEESTGGIYYQNDPAQAGYNPNEEHAIMAGGKPYAVRDDLNITNNTGYSSAAYVLVDYIDAEGRPGVSLFKVVREKPEDGQVFDYIAEAGQLLQPPMPLPLLPKPVAGSGDAAINYNREPFTGDLPVHWDAAVNTNEFEHYTRFTYLDRKQDLWVYRGPHYGRPALEAGAYDVASGVFTNLPAAVAVAEQPFRYSVHASRQDHTLQLITTNLPSWLSVDGLALTGSPDDTDIGYNGDITLVVEDLYDGARVTNQLSVSVIGIGTVMAQKALVLQSSNGYTGSVYDFSNRPPYLAASPVPTNSFAMQYYYKTIDGFAWPGFNEAPETGAIVPYLRAVTNNTYVGDGASSNAPALNIVYRPAWPVSDPADSSLPLPELKYGATLSRPVSGLPGVKDWITAEVLYQQSIAADMTNEAWSAVLHDPTVMKHFELKDFDDAVPSGVVVENYLGKLYFPGLPPHLEKRFVFDPNIGSGGSIVLIGEFRDEVLGEDYLQLNVLGPDDLSAVQALCPENDPEKAEWDNAVASLAVAVEIYVENTDVPGTYHPDTNLTEQAYAADPVVMRSDRIPRDSYALSATGPGGGYITMVENGGVPFTSPGDPVALHIFRVGSDKLHKGELKVIPAENPLSELLSFQHTSDHAGRTAEFEYEWRIAPPVDGLPPETDALMSNYQPLTSGVGLPLHTLGGAGIQALTDNYVVMRYKAVDPGHPLYDTWSAWTDPALAEGWIKRVLAGINPFNQRISDLFNNRVNTEVSILTQAGPRWQGDVALNLDTINDYGLIEIYETVLRRGLKLSIESGYNYGPANDALLLAAGYISDLYMMLGNEAWADAANPTIGIGTADNTYGDIATALFSFKGQQSSLLDEELALLRGRDDVLQPGVEIYPVFNRLIWNYTRGIDAGEVIYALNYNIQENPDREPDGIIDAEDAARMFPQGHGDAYGHYLTALKGYYSLLMNSHFDWVPRIEAVNVLGKPVSVDYQDERKFAAAAAAVARSGRQIFDLAWRKDYADTERQGWSGFSDERINEQRPYETVGSETNYPARYWGMDQWASRVGQGAYLNWVAGNSMLPHEDPNPDHEGIQKVDRTTVPELQELPVVAEGLQTAMDNAENGLSPLGISEDAIALDISPNIVGNSGETHFEQIYGRTKVALNNAVVAFDDAKDVTRLIRSEQDSLNDLQNRVAEQELAFRNALIEIFGTPYPDDIGPGKTWSQGYDGPDLIHYMYAETPEQDFEGLWNYPGNVHGGHTIDIALVDLPADWKDNLEYLSGSIADGVYASNDTVISYHIDPLGYLDKPDTWVGQRASPGKIQQAVSTEIAARNRMLRAVYSQSASWASLDKHLQVIQANVKNYKAARWLKRGVLVSDQIIRRIKLSNELIDVAQNAVKKTVEKTSEVTVEAIPRSFIAGTSAGGDVTSPARSALKVTSFTAKKTIDTLGFVRNAVVKYLEYGQSVAKDWVEFEAIYGLESEMEFRGSAIELSKEFEAMQDQLWDINEALRNYEDAMAGTRAAIAEGNRILEEREIFRKRSSALVQGYRTRDAAFRIFRNEKLERYKTLFDLAARYSVMAVNAYDYETGLLGTEEGKSFRDKIIQSRALGVVGADGEPQFAGSDTGDPGLSSALAEMKADWDVVKTRLGFNNPDGYGTTASLRSEHFRILPGEEGDLNWKEILHNARRRDLLEDSDVRRYCMQIAGESGLPVPGLVIEFSTTITDGENLFGRPLAAGDHAYSSSSFATKIHATGIALEGYIGMDDPAANSGNGGESPDDPDITFLDPNALSATPYIYLVPVGADMMRSPPLGDASGLRSWMVDDVAIPLPFNIGASDFSTTPMYQSSDTLSEPMFGARKHQSFRPVSDAGLFSPNIYAGTGGLLRSQYTNNRLVGRSVWNTRWKLVIPGKTLLSNPDEGLDRLIETLNDIKIHFITYSYSGN